MDKYNQYLEIARKNWLSLTFAGVAIIAILAIPLYVSGQRDELQNELKVRKMTYDKLEKLLNKPRHQPIVSLDPNTSPPNLNQFPSPAVIQAGEEAIKQVQAQSLALQKSAVAMNVHELLVSNSLPSGGDPFHFQQEYLQQFQKAIPDALNAATPPTEQEIKAEADRRAAQMTALAPQDDKKNIYNKDALEQSIRQMRLDLPAQMRLSAATQHKMYMGADALSIHPAFKTGQGGTQAATAENIWLAQVGLWVQQDVVAAIGELNHDSKQVSESPVKQLVLIDVPSDAKDLYVMPAVAQSGGIGGAVAASPVATITDTDPFPKDFTLSPTGRVCNGVFDVVHFSVVLNVDASDVEKVIQAMERNRLITVYQTEIEAIPNPTVLQQDGFYFGKGPAATLTLKCEELFMRDWSQKYMPPLIKKYLNVPEPQPGQPTALAN